MGDFEWIEEHEMTLSPRDMAKYLNERLDGTNLHIDVRDDSRYIGFMMTKRNMKGKMEGSNMMTVTNPNSTYYDEKDGEYYGTGIVDISISDILSKSKEHRDSTGKWTLRNPNGDGTGATCNRFSKLHYSRVKCAKEYRQMDELLNKILG